MIWTKRKEQRPTLAVTGRAQMPVKYHAHRDIHDESPTSYAGNVLSILGILAAVAHLVWRILETFL